MSWDRVLFSLICIKSWDFFPSSVLVLFTCSSQSSILHCFLFFFHFPSTRYFSSCRLCIQPLCAQHLADFCYRFALPVLDEPSRCLMFCNVVFTICIVDGSLTCYRTQIWTAAALIVLICLEKTRWRLPRMVWSYLHQH